MRCAAVAILMTYLSLALTLPAFAREDLRRAQIEAAHADAIAAVVDEVRTTRLLPDLTVGQFLEKTAGDEPLRQAVERGAEQIGATRWPNPGTCQVQVAVRGDKLAAALVDIAAADPSRSPIPFESLRKRIETSWDKRTFAATGTSASPDALDSLRPGPEQPLWLAVPEEDRRAAVKAAQHNAARRAMDGLSDIRLGDGKTLADALEVPAVRDSIQAWIATRPVTDIEYHDSGEVRVSVSAPGDDLWSVLRESAARQNEVPFPKDEAGWDALREEVVRRLRSPVGGRSAVDGGRFTAIRPDTRRALPQQPPRWVDDQLDGEGASSGKGPALRVAAAAEADAIKDLRRRIEALPLGDGQTLGDAAAADTRVAAAIDRALLRAKRYRVDWGVRDAATVRVALDLRHVWQELSSR